MHMAAPMRGCDGQKALSRSVEEFFRAGDWSAYRFVPHARHVLVNLPEGVAVEVGRTVIYLVGPTRTLRVYVQHNGRSADLCEYYRISKKAPWGRVSEDALRADRCPR
jgi:hypothetical protein